MCLIFVEVAQFEDLVDAVLLSESKYSPSPMSYSLTDFIIIIIIPLGMFQHDHHDKRSEFLPLHEVVPANVCYFQ